MQLWHGSDTAATFCHGTMAWHKRGRTVWVTVCLSRHRNEGGVTVTEYILSSYATIRRPHNQPSHDPPTHTHLTSAPLHRYQTVHRNLTALGNAPRLRRKRFIIIPKYCILLNDNKPLARIAGSRKGSEYFVNGSKRIQDRRIEIGSFDSFRVVSPFTCGSGTIRQMLCKCWEQVCSIVHDVYVSYVILT